MADRSSSDRSRRPSPSGDKHAPAPQAPAMPSESPTGHSNEPTLPGHATPTMPQTPAFGHPPDFEFLKELGRGGNGIVYKARQISLDRIVAVKMLPAERAKHTATLARFLEEARAAASFSHPNIVAVHHVGECPAGHFFVMEYVQGTTLHALLESRGTEKPVPIAWAVQTLVTVATAVHHAHQRGIFHRDLKPSNIIIERGTGRPVVLDFGIARRLDRNDPTATAIGTPAYMSPEQAGEAVGTLGTPSDVYALGAILYRMLTGRLPFVAATPLDTLLLVAGPGAADPVRKHRPEVPPILNAICMKCLHKKPLERYQSCEALVKDLKSFLSTHASSTSHPAAKRPSATNTPAATPTTSTPAAPATPATINAPAAPAAASTPAAPAMPAVPTGPGVVLESEQSGKKVRLTKAVSVIGRSAECDVLIRKEDVSKRHCRILIDGDSAEVEDLSSLAGTSVNGEPVTRRALSTGDRLQIACYSFRVTLDLKQ